MVDMPATEPPDGQASLAFNRELRDVNEALLVSSVHQHELTEQAQHAEAAARESEERYRALFESGPMAVFVCDTDAVIQQYNRRAANLWGREPVCGVEKHCGSTRRWLPEGTLLPHDQSPLAEVLRTGVAAHNVEVLLERSDGSQLRVLANVAPLKDARGQVGGAITSFIDITERSLLEEKTGEQAKALADLGRRKDEFLAMLSHELRNPLASILNAIQLLRLQRDGTEIQKEAHGMIDRQVAKLARLVDDLLEVSRITTGRIHLQEERIDLRGVVQRAIEATRPQCGQKGQTLGQSLPDEPLWVYGDPMRLEQVVVNLLDNASKYTDRKGHLWIGLAQLGTEAELRVRDNGMGIAPEMLPRIFDLFTQADKSLDRSQGGLGIGLALVQSLVTMHRGRVEVLSTPGQGSEFIVRLPVMLSQQVPTPGPAEGVPRPARPLKVLVVDDDVDAANGLAMLLRAYGHEAHVAHDGASAMQAALEFAPRVVLLDIGLPVINGLEVAKWIRQEPALNDVALIAVTGYGQESDLQRSRAAGFDQHLVKPVDFAKVLGLLSAVAEKVQ